MIRQHGKYIYCLLNLTVIQTLLLKIRKQLQVNVDKLHV